MKQFLNKVILTNLNVHLMSLRHGSPYSILFRLSNLLVLNFNELMNIMRETRRGHTVRYLRFNIYNSRDFFILTD